MHAVRQEQHAQTFDAGMYSGSCLLECIFVSCSNRLAPKPSAEHSMQMHNKICLSGWMHNSAHSALDAPVHISYVRLSPVDLLHAASVVCVLYHAVRCAMLMNKLAPQRRHGQVYKQDVWRVSC